LGSDFYETLMRAIGAKGVGHYSYIEDANDITRIISHSIHGLVDLIGSNCVVLLKDEKGKLIKIHDCNNVNEGYVLGDLIKGGITNIIAKYEVSPGKETREFEVFSYVLRYVSNEETRREIVKEGLFTIPCSENYSDVLINRDVLVSVKLKEYREANVIVKNLLSNNNISEAIEKKTQALEQLKEFEDESSGRVKKILDTEQQGLDYLKEQSQPDINTFDTNNTVYGSLKARMPTKGILKKTGLGGIQLLKAKKTFDSCDYMITNDNNFTYEYQDAEDSSSEKNDDENDEKNDDENVGSEES